MNPPPLPEPKPRWTRRLWIPASAALVIGALALFFWIRSDEPAPDVADLVLVPRELPAEENAFAVLAAAAASIHQTPWHADEVLFSQMTKGKSWDAARAARWLAANEHLWPEIGRAASLPLSQGPVLTSLDNMFPEVGPLRELAKLAMLRAWALHHTGRRDEAFAWVATSLHAASRISDSRSSVIMWLVGASCHGIARETLEHLAAAGPLSAADAAKLVRALEETRPSAASLADAIRAERSMFQLSLQATQRNPSAAAAASPDSVPLISRSGLFLKPHYTERLHAEYLRRAIRLIDADWRSIQAAAPDEKAFFGEGWRRWNPDNAAGRMLLGIVTPTLHTLLEKRLRLQSSISATQAFVALRAWDSERGALPQKLSELVPRYLPAVPRDHYDGQEIRYSRELRAVWSIGKDHFAPSVSNTAAGTDVYLHLAPPEP